MKAVEYAPHPALRAHVRRFLAVEFPEPVEDIHLPDTGAVAAFALAGECRLDGGRSAPAAAFTGVYDRLRHHAHRGGHTVLLTAFTPAGAAALVRAPMSDFAGTTADLAEVLGRPSDIFRLHERLADASDDAARIGLVEAFLLARIGNREPDPLVAAAVDWLERREGAAAATAPRIDDLARYIGLSQSALERRFRREIGVTPKRFASVVRLRRAIRLRERGAGLSEAAQAAGYFDQPHFTRDFRRAVGSAPDAFFRRFGVTP